MICTFCSQPAEIQCNWILASRDRCEARLCAACRRLRALDICVVHPHATWLDQESGAQPAQHAPESTLGPGQDAGR